VLERRLLFKTPGTHEALPELEQLGCYMLPSLFIRKGLLLLDTSRQPSGKRGNEEIGKRP